MTGVPSDAVGRPRWLVAGSGKRLYQLATLPEIARAAPIVGLWSPHRDERQAASVRFTLPTAECPTDLIEATRPDLVVSSVLTKELVWATIPHCRLALVGPLNWVDGRDGLLALRAASTRAPTSILVAPTVTLAAVPGESSAMRIRYHVAVGQARIDHLLSQRRALSVLASLTTSVLASLAAQGDVTAAGPPVVAAEMVTTDSSLSLHGHLGNLRFDVSLGLSPTNLGVCPGPHQLAPRSLWFAQDHPRFLVDTAQLFQDCRLYNTGQSCIYTDIALLTLKALSDEL